MTTKPRDSDARKNIKTDGVVRHRNNASQVKIDETLIILTQAYSHTGDALISKGNPEFLNYPGVTLSVKAGSVDHKVTLSPIHGHHDRVGGDEITPGTICRVGCPTSGEELESQGACGCGTGNLRTIFLTPTMDSAHTAAICDVWGCQRSRVIDEFEILSEFIDAELAESDARNA